MKFRWTIKELKEFSDLEMLRSLVAERKSTLHSYSPLTKRLEELYEKLDIQIKKQQSK